MTRESITVVMSSEKLFSHCARNVRQWNDVLHAHPSRISSTKCNKHNGKTVNAIYLPLDLKWLLDRTTWGLGIVALATKTTWIKCPNFENFGVWVLPFWLVCYPQNKCARQLVEQTMRMDASIWGRNLSLDPFCLAIASKSNVVDNKCWIGERVRSICFWIAKSLQSPKWLGVSRRVGQACAGGDVRLSVVRNTANASFHKWC